jgi:CD2 antigen cytoplasmic tail-binding protein 2
MKEGKRGERMSGSNKIIFDQLTEDSVKLMDNGDYNVYHEVKETFQREAEGYEALLRAKKGDDSGVHNDKTLGGMNGNSTQLDIFGDNDDSVDIFGSAEVNLATTNGGQGAPSVSDAATSNGFSEGSGYVYDETSG